MRIAVKYSKWLCCRLSLILLANVIVRETPSFELPKVPMEEQLHVPRNSTAVSVGFFAFWISFKHFLISWIRLHGVPPSGRKNFHCADVSCRYLIGRMMVSVVPSNQMTTVENEIRKPPTAFRAIKKNPSFISRVHYCSKGVRMRLSQTALLAFVGLQSIFLTNAFAPSASRVNTLSSTLQATVEKEAMVGGATDVINDEPKPLFTNIMAANRAEIAVRIMRAATELNAGTVGIYVNEDRYSQHRWAADRSFVLEKEEDATPISAYLDIPQIINIAKEAGVDAIHPGYGFLSESPEFAQACADAGITFVGPTVENLNRFSDKTSAREAAIAAGVPVVPGSDGALTTKEEVVTFVEGIGLPVIIKVS